MGHRVITTRESDEKMQVQGESERSEDGAPSATSCRRGLKRKFGEAIIEDEEDVDHLVVVDDEDADDEDLDDDEDDDDDDDDDEEEEDEDTDTEVRLTRPLTPLPPLRSPTTTTSSSLTCRSSYNRQSAHNVSIHKMNRYRQSADPSLRRMVLVYNTMRCIEKEMITEGVKLGSGIASANVMLLPAMDPPESMTLDPLPPPQMHTLPTPPSSTADHQLYHHNLHHNNHHHHNHHHHPHHHHHLLHHSHNANHNHHHSHLSLHSQQQQQHYDMDDNCYEKDTPSAMDATPATTSRHWTSATAISWSSVLDFSNQTEAESCALRTPAMSGGVVTAGPGSDDAWACEGGPVVGSNGGGPDTSPSSSSDSGISTASDEIFGDIDLSLYDFDILPPSPPSARFVPPSAEELLRSFAADVQLQNRQQQCASSSVATSTLPSVQVHAMVPSPSPTPTPSVPASTGASSPTTTTTTTVVTVTNGRHHGHRNEQLSEELDHIMHILVGM